MHAVLAMLGAAFAFVLSGCATTVPAAPSTPPQENVEQCPNTGSLLDASASDYGRSIIRKVGAKAFYPKEALVAREAGTVMLCVRLARSGVVERALVESSSGFAMLDGAALYALGLAAADADLGSPPAMTSATGGPIWYSLPVNFTDADHAPLPVAVSPGPSLCGRHQLQVPPKGSKADWRESAAMNKYLTSLVQRLSGELWYPTHTVAVREQGTANLCVEMRSDGSVAEARVLQSSGRPLFDGVALMAVGLLGLPPEQKPLPSADGESLMFEIPVIWQM